MRACHDFIPDGESSLSRASNNKLIMSSLQIIIACKRLGPGITKTLRVKMFFNYFFLNTDGSTSLPGAPGLFKTGPRNFRIRQEKTVGIMAFCHTAILEIRLIVI